MNELQQLTPEQEREAEAYGDGVEAGINMVIRELTHIYHDRAELYNLAFCVEKLLKSYGVDLDEPESVSKP